MSLADIKKKVDLLYTGRSRDAARFRYGLIAFDVFTICFVIVTVPMETTATLFAADVAIATTFGPNTLQGFRVWTDEIAGSA